MEGRRKREREWGRTRVRVVRKEERERNEERKGEKKKLKVLSPISIFLQLNNFIQ